MKTRIEPNKLKCFLEAGMLTNLIDPLVLDTDENGVTIMNMYGGSVATNHYYEKVFFINYAQKGKETIAIPKLISKNIGMGFSDDEIDFITDDESYYLIGKRINYDHELDEVPLEIKMPEYTKKLMKVVNKKKKVIGYIPSSKDKCDPEVIVLLDASELRIPTAKEYDLDMTGEEIVISNSDEGNLRIKLKIDSIIKKKNVHRKITGDFFKSVASCLDGTVMMAIDAKDTTGIDLIFSEIGKGYRKCFCIAGIDESEDDDDDDEDKDK